MRALFTNVQANEVVQGGSTLTQQLAKNLFLSSERSLPAQDQGGVPRVPAGEPILNKREILKLYFDRAYMGGGAFGVEAASQYYFGKSVRDITCRKSAMLAGLFKAPTKYCAARRSRRPRAHAPIRFSTNLVEAGFYTAGQVHEARVHPGARSSRARNPDSPDWFLDWAFEEVQRLADGQEPYVLTARTTIDSTLQRQADEALARALARKAAATISRPARSSSWRRTGR